MTADNVPQWLAWAREIQALSQTGLTYSEIEYDRERYQRLGEIAAEIVQAHTNLPLDAILADFQVQPGYATPKVDVRGAIVRDGRILLVQERVDGKWCMPGGWADPGQAPSKQVMREVWEESGFQVVPRKLIGVYDADSGRVPLSFYHAYKLLFLCELTGGEACPSYETLAVDFFSFDDLPPLSNSRTSERHLREVQAHLEHGDLASTFD